MAYLRDLPQPRCTCGKPARVTLYNRVNAPVGELLPRVWGARAKETGQTRGDELAHRRSKELTHG